MNEEQFFTKVGVAKECYLHLLNFLWAKYPKLSIDKWTFLEPSAGDGSFLKVLPENTIALDISPQNPEIIGEDFYDFDMRGTERLIAIGCPPIGNNSSSAVKFFNHAATFSEIIAFIVPKSFQKDAVQRRLNSYFVLEAELDLPIYSFLKDGKDHEVPSVFQVWRKTGKKRRVERKTFTHEDFSFVAVENADFAIQRVGVSAGKIKTSFRDYSKWSHYFIKVNHSGALEVFSQLDFSNIKVSSLGNPSISKVDIIKAYSKKLIEITSRQSIEKI